MVVRVRTRCGVLQDFTVVWNSFVSRLCSFGAEYMLAGLRVAPLSTGWLSHRERISPGSFSIIERLFKEFIESIGVADAVRKRLLVLVHR